MPREWPRVGVPVTVPAQQHMRLSPPARHAADSQGTATLCHRGTSCASATAAALPRREETLRKTKPCPVSPSSHPQPRTGAATYHGRGWAVCSAVCFTPAPARGDVGMVPGIAHGKGESQDLFACWGQSHSLAWGGAPWAHPWGALHCTAARGIPVLGSLVVRRGSSYWGPWALHEHSPGFLELDPAEEAPAGMQRASSPPRLHKRPRGAAGLCTNSNSLFTSRQRGPGCRHGIAPATCLRSSITPRHPGGGVGDTPTPSLTAHRSPATLCCSFPPGRATSCPHQTTLRCRAQGVFPAQAPAQWVHCTAPPASCKGTLEEQICLWRAQTETASGGDFLARATPRDFGPTVGPPAPAGQHPPCPVSSPSTGQCFCTNISPPSSSSAHRHGPAAPKIILQPTTNPLGMEQRPPSKVQTEILGVEERSRGVLPRYLEYTTSTQADDPTVIILA